MEPNKQRVLWAIEKANDSIDYLKMCLDEADRETAIDIMRQVLVLTDATKAMGEIYNKL